MGRTLISQRNVTYRGRLLSAYKFKKERKNELNMRKFKKVISDSYLRMDNVSINEI